MPRVDMRHVEQDMYIYSIECHRRYNLIHHRTMCITAPSCHPIESESEACTNLFIPYVSSYSRTHKYVNIKYNQIFYILLLLYLFGSVLFSCSSHIHYTMACAWHTHSTVMLIRVFCDWTKCSLFIWLWDGITICGIFALYLRSARERSVWLVRLFVYVVGITDSPEKYCTQ